MSSELLRDFNIIWDFDGTICDTYPLITKIFFDYARRNGVAVSYEEALGHLSTHRSDETFRHFGLEYPGAAVRHGNELRHASEYPTPLFEGVISAMGLAEGNFLVSNRDFASMITILHSQPDTDLPLKDFINAARGKLWDFPRKPESAMYAEAVRRHGRIDLVVGDRELDMIPARELGIRTCVYRSPQVEADHSIDSYLDFLGVYLAELFSIEVPSAPVPVDCAFLERELSGDSHLEHALGVARRGELRASAVLHDIGYASSYARTGFHPLDGALAALELGYTGSSVLMPILFHSYSDRRAELEDVPGLARLYGKLGCFRNSDELRGEIDRLTLLDMTTGTHGESVSVGERISEVLGRYPVDHPAVTSLSGALEDLR